MLRKKRTSTQSNNHMNPPLNKPISDRLSFHLRNNNRKRLTHNAYRSNNLNSWLINNVSTNCSKMLICWGSSQPFTQIVFAISVEWTKMSPLTFKPKWKKYSANTISKKYVRRKTWESLWILSFKVIIKWNSIRMSCTIWRHRMSNRI